MVSRGKAEQRAARDARLSAALRENLKRRKAQARGRDATRTAEMSSSDAEKGGQETPDFRRNEGRD